MPKKDGRGKPNIMTEKITKAMENWYDDAFGDDPTGKIFNEYKHIVRMTIMTKFNELDIEERIYDDAKIVSFYVVSGYCDIINKDERKFNNKNIEQMIIFTRIPCNNMIKHQNICVAFVKFKNNKYKAIRYRYMKNPYLTYKVR